MTKTPSSTTTPPERTLPAFLDRYERSLTNALAPALQRLNDGLDAEVVFPWEQAEFRQDFYEWATYAVACVATSDVAGATPEMATEYLAMQSMKEADALLRDAQSRAANRDSAAQARWKEFVTYKQRQRHWAQAGARATSSTGGQ